MYPRKITFRLQTAEAKKLYHEALNSKESVHQTARDYVVERLTLADMERHLQSMTAELQELKIAYSEALSEMQGLKAGISSAFAVLLARESENVSMESAKEWVIEQFEILD